jgi:hypothetical protein
MANQLALIFNYLFCSFSIFYSFKVLKQRNFKSILAVANLSFIFQNMLGTYWLQNYLSESTLISFNSDIYQRMIFFHILQSIIFICGISTYKIKFRSLNLIFIKIITLILIIPIKLRLLWFAIAYQLFNSFFLLKAKKIKENNIGKLNSVTKKNILFVNGEYSITILIFCLFSYFLSSVILLQGNLFSGVLLLLSSTYSTQETYAIRIEQITGGFVSLFGIPAIDQFIPLIYFNFAPFFSIYYLLLFLYTSFTNITLKLFLLFTFLIGFIISFFVTLSTLAKARFVVYMMSLLISLIFFFLVQQRIKKTLVSSKNTFFSNRNVSHRSKNNNRHRIILILSIFFSIFFIVSALYFTYSITGYAENLSTIEVIQEQLYRIFVVPIASSYSWFYTYPKVLDYPMFGLDKNLASLLGVNIADPLSFVLAVSRYAYEYESFLVTNFIAYSHAQFGSLGFLTLIPYTVITVFLDKKLDVLAFTYPVLVLAVYCFVYPVLITAVNVSIDSAVMNFGVWTIPVLVLILSKIDVLKLKHRNSLKYNIQ